jgi:hypothetical protein
MLKVAAPPASIERGVLDTRESGRPRHAVQPFRREVARLIVEPYAAAGHCRLGPRITSQTALKTFCLSLVPEPLGCGAMKVCLSSR